MAALPASLSALFISIRNFVLGKEGLIQSRVQAEASEQPDECEGRACLTSTM